MRKTTLHIIILLSILIVSCKKEIKTDEKKVVLKNELKTELIDTLKTVKAKNSPRKKLKKQVAIDTLIIQKDTLFIEDKHFLNKTTSNSKCKGKLNGVDIYFIAKTNDYSEYLYCIGANSKRAVTYGKDSNQPHTEQKLTILLLNKSKIIDKLDLSNFIRPSYNINLMNPPDIKLANVDEIIEVNYNQAFCGGTDISLYFFRKKNRLIKGFELEQGGETGTEYFEQNIIKSNEKEPNQIWIENKVGKEDLIYFTYKEKYEFRNDSLLRLNPKKEEFFYVTAKNGLTQRSEPSIKGESLGKLTYKTKVKVLNRTDIKMSFNDNGKQVSGHWVQIEYNGEQLYDHSFFVFDGYLSKKEPIE